MKKNLDSKNNGSTSKERKNGNPKSKINRTLTAAILFLLINIALFLVNKFYGLHWSETCDYIITTFEHTNQKPNIVLLGSSIMRDPFYLSDKKHSYDMPIYQQYYSVRTLANLLNNSEENGNAVFNLAIDGAMASDVFFINKKLLIEPKIPKWIVYGIAPRDFLDSYFSKETRTPIFDRLFSLEDIWREKSSVDISLDEKINLTVEKFYLLYGQRSVIQNRLEDLCHQLYDNSLLSESSKLNSKDKTPDSVSKMLSDANIKCYRRRYKAFRPLIFNKQKSFIKALCEESRKKGTNVLLVNMPLTQEIKNLLPAESYNAYNQALAETSKLPGVWLLDLDKSKDFPDKYFKDMVHLNAQGGDLLNKLIASTLLDCDRQQSALERLAISKNQNAQR